MIESAASAPANAKLPACFAYVLFRLEQSQSASETEGVELPVKIPMAPAQIAPECWPETLHSNEMVDFENLVDRRASQLVERIKQKLMEDSAHARGSEDVTPSETAIATCLALARRLAPHVALAPHLKSGAFTEDGGGISLVLQSLVTDRRLNCRVTADGSAVSAIRIDECMEAECHAISLDDPNAARELAEWVTKSV